MRKNSLIQMLFESEPYTGADRREEDQLGPSIFELPRDRGTSYEQNKLIKITQFDHSRLVNDSLLCKTSSGAFASTTPQKNFTLKKFHEFKAAPTHKLAIVQVKRKSSKF